MLVVPFFGNTMAREEEVKHALDVYGRRRQKLHTRGRVVDTGKGSWHSYSSITINVYLKLSRSVGPRRVDFRHLAIPHLPLLRGRHELQHAPRTALLRRSRRELTKRRLCYTLEGWVGQRGIETPLTFTRRVSRGGGQSLGMATKSQNMPPSSSFRQGPTLDHLLISSSFGIVCCHINFAHVRAYTSGSRCSRKRIVSDKTV